MKSFNLHIYEAVRYGENRCTAHYKLQAAKLGPGHNVSTGAGVYQYLRRHGMKMKGDGLEHDGKYVKKFVAKHPSGVHYIATRGHAMAVVNGKLHERGADGRKIFNYIGK